MSNFLGVIFFKKYSSQLRSDILLYNNLQYIQDISFYTKKKYSYIKNCMHIHTSGGDTGLLHSLLEILRKIFIKEDDCEYKNF